MRQDALGLGAQTAFGTPQATMEYWPPVETVEISDEGETIEIEETTGTRFPARIEKGTQLYELQVKAPALRLTSAPRLLSLFLGEPATSTPDGVGAPNARDHLFPATAGASPTPHGLTVSRTDPDPGLFDRFDDSVGDEFTLSCEVNGKLAFEGTAVALEKTEVVEPTPTIDTSTAMTFDKISVYAKDDAAAEAEINVSAFSVTYSNDLDREGGVLGSRKHGSLDEGNASAEIEFTVRDKADVERWYRLMDEADPSKMQIRVQAVGAVLGGAVTEEVEVKAWCAEVIEAPANLNAAERLNSVTVKLRCALDTVTGKFVTFQITNEVAAY